MRILQIATSVLALSCLLQVPLDAATRLSNSLITTSLNEASPSPGSQNSSRRPVKRITITGKLTDEGAECQAFRSNNGILYTLTGNLRGLRKGDKVRVVGRVAEMSTCMQGTTLVVESIRKIK